MIYWQVENNFVQSYLDAAPVEWLTIVMTFKMAVALAQWSFWIPRDPVQIQSTTVIYQNNYLLLAVQKDIDNSQKILEMNHTTNGCSTSLKSLQTIVAADGAEGEAFGSGRGSLGGLERAQH